MLPIEQRAKMLNCSVADFKRLRAANASQLLEMADEAASIGRKVNGYTEQQLREYAARAQQDAAIRIGDIT